RPRKSMRQKFLSGQSRWRYRCESRADRLGPAASRRRVSLAGRELPLDVFVRYDLAAIGCVDSAGHFGEKVEPFHHVLDRGIVWNLLDGFTQQLLGGGHRTLGRWRFFSVRTRCRWKQGP